MISLPYIPNINKTNQKEILVPCIDNYSTYIAFHNYKVYQDEQQNVSHKAAPLLLTKKEIKNKMTIPDKKKQSNTIQVHKDYTKNDNEETKRVNHFIKRLPSISTSKKRFSVASKQRKKYSMSNSATHTDITSLNLHTHFNPKNYYSSLNEIQHLFMFDQISVPKTKISHDNPTFQFYVNRTYREQIPLYMKHRINWKFVVNKKEGYNFRWKYYSGKINYNNFQYNPKTPMEKLKMLNVFEKYSNLGNKEKMFINLLKYCNEKRLNVFQYVPFTIILSKSFQFKNTIESLSKLIEFCFSLQKSPIKKNQEGYFTSSFYTDLFQIDPHRLNNGKIDDILIYFPKAFISQQNYWIVKPVDLYQGLGMKVTNNINEIISHSKVLIKGIEKRTSELDSLCEKTNKEIKGKKYRASNIIIQKYLDFPLLYYNRKFDIRCYVLVDHCFNVFLCREGHLKACSVNYSIDTTDKFTHLTNYSLQKKCEMFSKYEQGNEISYKQFKESLQSQGYNGEEDFKKIYSKMKDLILVSMNAVGKKLKTVPNALSFQIFGYDFIIDKYLNPYILEINDNPGLEISSELISHLIPRMVDDAFRLTIDKIFETVYDNEVCSQDEFGNFIYKSKYKLEGYKDTENIFEFLCNINKSPLKEI